MARQPDPALRSQWQSLIQQQPQSGLTVAAFCDSRGVSTGSFYQWRRKLAQEPPHRPAFLPVRVSEEPVAASPIRIRFDCGAVAEIPADDQQSLASVIDKLLANAEQPSR